MNTNRFMRKSALFFLTLCLVVSLAACAKKEPDDATQAELHTGIDVSQTTTSPAAQPEIDYEALEGAEAFYYKQMLQIDTGGFALCPYEEKEEMHYVITQFDPEDGVLDAEGQISPDEEGTHSRLFPVTEGKSCYVGFKDPDMAVAGAFYSDEGEWLAPLAADGIQSYDYQSPNGIEGSWYFEDEENGSGYRYLRLYAFSVPENAAYVSLNLSDKPEYAYRQFLASMPVYTLSNAGNMIWSDSEPLYERMKDKKLCIIGQSNVMIDRVLRNTNPGEACPNQYIAGFQEYLIPWFQSVDTYGYSGKGYMKNGATGIYDYVIDGEVDLSGYDVFLFTPGGNALTLDNMGEYDSTEVDTYFGAMNALIDYVFAQNPGASPEIYISNLIIRENIDSDSAYVRRSTLLNEKLRQFAIYRGCTFLDLQDNVGLNAENLSEWSYDGTHANQFGNREIGLGYRRLLLNF